MAAGEVLYIRRLSGCYMILTFSCSTRLIYPVLLNCAPKVGHKVKFNGKSELFSKNSSSTDARVREKYQVNLS